MNELLPCQKCENLCAIDADRCPNCGTKDIHGFPSKTKCFLYGVASFIFASFLSNLDGQGSSNGLIGMFFIFGIIGFLAGFYRSAILKFASKLRKE
jgi:hypothetical protein